VVAVIPQNITKSHLLRALEEMNKQGLQPPLPSIRYFVKYKDELYPLKRVVSLANKYANGTKLPLQNFTTTEAVSFVIKLGFELEVKNMSSKEEPMEGFDENLVVDICKDFLKARGYTIISIATKKQKGPDIEAEKNGVRVIVEAKGYPARIYVKGSKKGIKKASPRLQARL